MNFLVLFFILYGRISKSCQSVFVFQINIIFANNIFIFLFFSYYSYFISFFFRKKNFKIWLINWNPLWMWIYFLFFLSVFFFDTLLYSGVNFSIFGSRIVLFISLFQRRFFKFFHYFLFMNFCNNFNFRPIRRMKRRIIRLKILGLKNFFAINLSKSLLVKNQISNLKIKNFRKSFV